MTIGIDIDNVLNNLCESVLLVYNEDSGDNLNINNITSYYIENFVKERFKENFKNYFLDRRVWKKIQIIKNCQKYIAKLYNDGNNIIFITSTEQENLQKKASWLKKNFPFLNIRKALYSCPKKQYMSGIDLLIDDAPQNFYRAKYKGIILDYPWNKEFKEDNINFFRAKNWEDIYNIINNKIKE